MIFIILGTQDKNFYRLLDAVQKQIDNKNIKEKVIVQAGYSSDYKSKDMEIIDLIPIDKFNELIKKADLIITHAGVGSIIDTIKNNKKVIVASRLKKYKEHTNDHQLQIAKKFTDLGYVLELIDFDKLDELIKESKKFVPKKFESNNKKMLKIINEYIDNN